MTQDTDPTLPKTPALRVLLIDAPQAEIDRLGQCLSEQGYTVQMPDAADTASVQAALAREPGHAAIAQISLTRSPLNTTQRLRELSVHLQELLDEERRELAREVHDEIGGGLSALRYDLTWIARSGEALVQQRAEQALETLAQIQHTTQRLIKDLRPPVLDAGIFAAIQWQLDGFRKRTGIETILKSNAQQIELESGTAMTVYRALQEALTNVVKHACASSVIVDMVCDDAQLSIEFSDNGRGLSQQDIDKPSGFGLRGIGERARAVGGWLEVSPSQHGTTLFLTVPLAHRNAGAHPDRAEISR